MATIHLELSAKGCPPFRAVRRSINSCKNRSRNSSNNKPATNGPFLGVEFGLVTLFSNLKLGYMLYRNWGPPTPQLHTWEWWDALWREVRNSCAICPFHIEQVCSRENLIYYCILNFTNSFHQIPMTRASQKTTPHPDATLRYCLA